MQLTGSTVTHRVFGQGTVTEVGDTTLTVRFAQGEKQFLYPEAFQNFLQADDPALQAQLLEILQQLEQETNRHLRVQQAEDELMLRLRKLKLLPNSQAALACLENTPDDIFDRGWAAPGCYLSGASKGLPRTPTGLKPNSACVVTQCPAGEPETARQIVGAFLLPDDFDGAACKSGQIPCHRSYRLPYQGKPLLFWDYFDPADRPANWGRTEMRYFTTEIMQKMLHDIALATTGTEDQELSAGTYHYFCNVNRLPVEFEIAPL